MSKKLINKKTLLGAALLASAPALKGSGGGITEGGKSQRGVNHLTLEEVPGFFKPEEEQELIDKLNSKIKICVPNNIGKTGEFHFLPNTIAVVMPPFETNVVRMTFVVSHMVAGNIDKVLLLAYSQQLAPSEQIPTPKSLKKLKLDLSSAEVVGYYNIPAIKTKPQNETRIGAADPAPRSKIEFDINLSPQNISTMMNSGTNTIYVQAALLPKADFESGKWDRMILSEMDTIQFMANECPEDHTVYDPSQQNSGVVPIDDF
jgi:hypothetical protein